MRDDPVSKNNPLLDMNLTLYCVATMWRTARTRLVTPVILLDIPEDDICRLYYCSVFGVVEWVQRKGYIPTDGEKPEIPFRAAGNDTVFIAHAQAIFDVAVADTLSHLRLYPNAADPASNILNRMWNECIAYLNRLAVVAEGAPPPPNA